MKKKSVLAWIWDFVSLHKIYFVLNLIFAFASVISGFLPYFFIGGMINQLLDGNKNLKPKPYRPPDLTDLKQKYQRLIDEIEQNHAAGKLSSRKAHQKLSHVLRMFVVEINGHRVDTLML